MTSNTNPRYALRESDNHKFIDIVPAGAGRGIGYECRVPVRDGRREHAEFVASLICSLLNEYTALAARGRP